MLLTTIVFLPLLGAIAILLVPGNRVALIKGVATAATALALLLSICLVVRFDYKNAEMQFQEKAAWIPSINVNYHLGADGLSVGLIFLTGLLGFFACVASYGIPMRQKEYFFLYLLLCTGMFGTFAALDLFLFYVFWEVVLVPMYFLIGIWGGPRKEYAAIKFFVYTLAGSVFMLLSILALYFASEPHTFDMLALRDVLSSPALSGKSTVLGLSRGAFGILVFIGFYLGFAIKVPVFPFHTWLPDAHVEAPTPISVLLAAILLKMGGYGFFRISFPMLPDAARTLALGFAILGVINIVYGAIVAMGQTDFKKMVAYSSVSHMGFVMLGLASLNAVGFNGALLEMFNHGAITGGMFLLVGVLYDRAHTRDLNSFGGLGVQVPVYAGILTVFTLASLGLPGLSGFVSELLSLMGAFSSAAVPGIKILTIISVVGLVITAAYFLYMLQRILLGPLNEKWAGMPEINARELFTLVPIMIIIIAVGVYPSIALRYQSTALDLLVQYLALGG